MTFCWNQKSLGEISDAELTAALEFINVELGKIPVIDLSNPPKKLEARVYNEKQAQKMEARKVEYEAFKAAVEAEILKRKPVEGEP